MVPVPGIMVTLHRVGSDTAGPVDSMPTSAAGRYHFDYHRTGAADAVYFAAASYGGVAYFSAPFKMGAAPTRDDAEIDVFDTTSGPVPISVRGRHLVVSAVSAGGDRQVTEVFELSNDSTVTRVAVGDAPSDACWSVMLPAGAKDPAVTEGDIPPGAVEFAEGRALVFAPLAPGVKQLVVSYTLPEKAFPLSLALVHGAGVFEVLLEEPTATVTGARLKAMGPVSLAGRQFHRFLATDAPANAVARVEVPVVEEPISTGYMVALTLMIGGAMVGTLAYALRRR
jgi:hypothetical protein